MRRAGVAWLLLAGLGLGLGLSPRGAAAADEPPGEIRKDLVAILRDLFFRQRFHYLYWLLSPIMVCVFWSAATRRWFVVQALACLESFR